MGGMLALRYVYVLVLALWLGGMVVLGALVAPSTFQVLQAADPETGRSLAGMLFGTILSRFHFVSYAACGTLLIVLCVMAVLGPRPVQFAIRCLLITAMLAVSLYSGIVVLGEIDGIQQQVGILVSKLDVADPRRIRFDQLHVLSERLMLVNVVGALALLFWEARER
jgi:hypothetical protein